MWPVWCENFKINFLTCEIYKCGSCEEKFATLADVKGHIRTEHINIMNLLTVYHVKQKRTENSVIDENPHRLKNAKK